MKRVFLITLPIILLAVIVAGVLHSRKPKKVSRELALLSAEQRAAIVKATPTSLDALTPASPAVDELRKAVKGANVVICVLDAARADHFGCYGYPRDTTPNLDTLAKESFLFGRHYCQYPSTLPSTECLFSSQYSDTHGIADPSYDETDENGDMEIQVQREPSFTFPIGLEAAGYTTVLLTGSGRASPTSGIGIGFSEGYYHHSLEPFIRKGEHRYTPTVPLRALGSWLNTNKKTPFFMYIHFGPPHRPYEQPEHYTQLFENKTPPGFAAEKYTPGHYLFPLRVKKEFKDTPPVMEWINLYDSNLRYGDWAIGEVKRLLEKHGLYDKTLLIVTSDHGECFGEHGFIWHTGGIYEEATRIPLLIRLPGMPVSEKSIPALTQTIDLFPTVYDLLQVPLPKEGIQGKSLLPLMSGDKTSVYEASFTRSDDPTKYMIRTLNESLLVYTNPKWRALYDSSADPAFNRNIINEKPQRAEALYRMFLQFANSQKYPPAEFQGITRKTADKRAGKTLKLTPEMQRELKTLGYLK